jgi:hypothetical protein
MNSPPPRTGAQPVPDDANPAPATSTTDPVAAPPPHETRRRLLHNRAFQRFWCARVLSSLSFQMLAVAMGWHIYALTHSAFALGLVGLSQFLPMFVLTLVVGHVADRYDRRRIAGLC